MILSSSFVGSPRWYNAKFQDGMAIVRKFHKPDLFITMTCNPGWPEISGELLDGQSPQDRPDIVARVFKQKMDQLIDDLTKEKKDDQTKEKKMELGQVVGYMYTIEFQKRGLPHCHILLILRQEDRGLTPEAVDSLVVAELPPSPDDTDDPEEKAQREKLLEIVLNCMIHGPCGAGSPRPCCKTGKCDKNFPKPFAEKTIVDRDNFFATYRRRSPEAGGRELRHPHSGKLINNSWVVPYNPFLSLRFNCHINIEFCCSVKAAKYLFKYVCKGNDRAMVAIENEGDKQAVDEIQMYEDLRSVGSSEAVWHLMSYPITDRSPPVLALRVHLEEEQWVVYDEQTEQEAVEKQKETELTAFFKFNRQNPGQQTLYVDMPEDHVYDRAKKAWKKRQRDMKKKQIGRVHTVNPVAGDVFYLRMLLHNDHSKGKTSYRDLRTLPSGVECETFKHVCVELGLLQDDEEWKKVLEEAALSRMPAKLRELFVIILVFCQPSQPGQLFEEFWQDWVEDFEQKSQSRGVELTEQQKKTMLLLDLEMRLQSFEMQLRHCELPELTAEDLASVQHVARTDPVVIREELDFDVDELRTTVEQRVPSFTDEQRTIYDEVMGAVRGKQSLVAFVDARGGCGKTYLLNTILDAVRSSETDGCTALAMATTGIAATLLNNGRTFHSRMKAPLDPDEESTLAISAQSALAKLIRRSQVLMIDEATMLDRYQLEALDRTLRFLEGDEETPFGGKILILAGDFRQCLPVVPGASRAGTVKHCINRSHLWTHFKVFSLTQNMRVRSSGNQELQDFDNWTLSIGDGQSGDISLRSEMVVTEIKRNKTGAMGLEGQSMREFCEKVFPQIGQGLELSNDWLAGRAILATTNREVDSLNQVVSDMIPGEYQTFCSADTLENIEDLYRFNTEYLNTLSPNGFPSHMIRIKPGTPLMLLRNINPREGLCNGTRLLFRQAINNRILECSIMSSGRVVLIPRICFIPKVNEYPFSWQRRQFPVRPAFAMTINKSQGQTLRMAAVWLRNQVFAHGQLYVACSRVQTPADLKFAVYVEDKDSINNVVYHEVLLPQV